MWFDVTIARPPSRQRRPHDSDTYWLGVFLKGGSFGRADPEGVWESDAPAMLCKKGMGVETCYSAQVRPKLWQGSKPCVLCAPRQIGIQMLGFMAKVRVQASVDDLTSPYKPPQASPAIALAAATCTTA